MITITAVLPIPGPAGSPIHFGRMEFCAGPHGELEHYLDGNLWASVPPEGWDDYAKAWPACADLVAQLKRSAAPAASGSTLEPAPGEKEAVDALIAAGWRPPML